MSCLQSPGNKIKRFRQLLFELLKAHAFSARDIGQGQAPGRQCAKSLGCETATEYRAQNEADKKQDERQQSKRAQAEGLIGLCQQASESP